MRKFVASRISEGNRFFPDEIIIDENTVTVKSPKLIGGTSKSFTLGQISVSIRSPFIGYCDITLFAFGTSICVHGFTDKDAENIKNLINEGGNVNKNDSYNNFNDSTRYRLHDDIEFKNTMNELAEANREQNEGIESLIKRVSKLITTCFFKLNTLSENSNEYQEVSEKLDHYEDKLIEYLKMIDEDNWDERYGKIINASSDEAEHLKLEIKKEKSINKSSKKASKNKVEDTVYNKKQNIGFNYSESDLKTYVHKLKNIIKAFDDLKIDIIESNEQIESHNRLINRFARRILEKEGFELFLESIENDVIKDDYTNELIKLLDIIYECYFIINQIENESKKKYFSFGLKHTNIQEFLKDSNNSPKEKILKIIDCIDNLIQKFSNFINAVS